MRLGATEMLLSATGMRLGATEMRMDGTEMRMSATEMRMGGTEMRLGATECGWRISLLHRGGGLMAKTLIFCHMHYAQQKGRISLYATNMARRNKNKGKRCVATSK